ncbi:MAG: hypothetical protein ACI4QM_00990, partial [Alphaproteobacteria bacterium]
MKNYVYGLCAVCCAFYGSVAAAEVPQIMHTVLDYSEHLPQTYGSFKKTLHDEYGLDYRIRAGFMGQRGAPNGENTVFRDKYEVEANWEAFSSDTVGSGSVQLLYEDINYSHIEASKMNVRLGVLDPINDDALRREYFKRLTYTHRLAGQMDWLSLSVGQYLIGSFGKTSYKAVPLYHFNNFALAKNMTKGYPTGGVGGYVTARLSDTVTVIAGAQDTTNYFPQNISVKNIDENKWTNFVYMLYSPYLTDLGKTVISGWVYHSPAIKKYSGQFNKAFTKPADGFNVTVRQNIGPKWVVFGKVNASTGNRMNMEQSYVLNVMYNNPFNRNALDQIGVGTAVNKVSNLNKK